MHLSLFFLHNVYTTIFLHVIVTDLKSICGWSDSEKIYKKYGEVNSVKNTTINVWLNDDVY